MKCYMIKSLGSNPHTIVNANSFSEAIKKSEIEEKEIMEIVFLGVVKE